MCCLLLLFCTPAKHCSRPLFSPSAHRPSQCSINEMAILFPKPLQVVLTRAAKEPGHVSQVRTLSLPGARLIAAPLSHPLFCPLVLSLSLYFCTMYFQIAASSLLSLSPKQGAALSSLAVAGWAAQRGPLDCPSFCQPCHSCEV